MKQITIANPDRELTKEERRRYEAREADRRIFILQQVVWIRGGRNGDPPDFVPCPIDPRK